MQGGRSTFGVEINLALLPSSELIQILIWPLRSETNATWSPLGETTGIELLNFNCSKLVKSLLDSLVSVFMRWIWLFCEGSLPGWVFIQTICNESGTQEGMRFTPSSIRTRAFLPSISEMQSERAWPIRSTYKSFLPSGEHDGIWQPRFELVICWDPEPSSFMRYSCRIPLSSVWLTISSRNLVTVRVVGIFSARVGATNKIPIATIRGRRLMIRFIMGGEKKPLH